MIVAIFIFSLLNLVCNIVLGLFLSIILTGVYKKVRQKKLKKYN